MDNLKQPTFQKHKLIDSPIYDFAVSIMALNKDCSEVCASGTGVVISTNLILTAKHVFDDFKNKWKLKIGKEGLIAEDFNIWAVFVANTSGELYHVYEVASVYINPYSDLVLFHLNPFDKTGKNHLWKQCLLSLALPKVGQRVVAFGFAKSNVEIKKKPDGQVEIDVNDEPSVSAGEIIEVYPERRDSSRLNFPSFRINARLDGGMSGGPIFNETGELIGLVCSSFDQLDAGEYLSYATLLWPLMATPLVDKEGQAFPLYDLALKKVISVNGLNHLVVTKTETNSKFKISYR